MKPLKLKLRNLSPDQNPVTASSIAMPAFRIRPADTEWSPALEVTEGPSEYLVQADLPGLRPTEVVVSVDADSLSITGERLPPRASGDKTLLAERPCGSFVRCLTVPGDALTREMQATLSNGVLELRIPRTRAESQNEASEAEAWQQPEDASSSSLPNKTVG